MCDLQPGSVNQIVSNSCFQALWPIWSRAKPKRLPPLSLYFFRPPGRAYGKGSGIVYGFGPCLDNTSLIQEELPWTAGYCESRFSLQLRPEGWVPFFGVAVGAGGGGERWERVMMERRWVLHSMRVELGQPDSCHSKEVNDTTLLACPSLRLSSFSPNQAQMSGWCLANAHWLDSDLGRGKEREREREKGRRWLGDEDEHGAYGFWPEALKRHARKVGGVSTCANRRGIFITINTLVGTAGWLLDELMYFLPFCPTYPPAPNATNRVKWLIKAHGEWAANFISCPSTETPAIWFAHGWRGRSRVHGCQLSSTRSYGYAIRLWMIAG